MPHILVAGKIHASGLALLQAAKNMTFDLVEPVTTEAYLPLLPKADALLLRTQPLTEAMLTIAPNLKIVSRHGVGYDAVDVAALTKRNIPLCIVGDVNSRAVAEHTMMLMLAAARRTVAHDHAAKNRNWNERNTFNSAELDGKTLLIIGFGRIGKRVAQLAEAFGMKVIVNDAFANVASIDLDTALPQADYITLHTPAARTPIITAKKLALMKPTAILINAARGDLIDEAALDIALRQNRLRHAALDVLSTEPPPSDHPILTNPRVTITPHNAGLTEECAARMAVASAQNIVNFFNGNLDLSLVINK
jgi:D-3-phosphoglycerate dehydrogenase / 2-oxoglutarate reductase